MRDKELLLQYNLQWFAKEGPGGEKTEPATQKKLDDARKEGQVAKSKEISTAVTLFTLFLTLKIFAGLMGRQFIENFNFVYSQIADFTTLTDGIISVHDFCVLLNTVILRIILILLPVMGIGLVAGFIIEIVQVKWKPTSKPLKPKGSKLNPLKGVKRIFSKTKLVELLKSLLKLAMIGYVVYSTLVDQVSTLFLLYDMKLITAIQTFGNMAINLGLKISAFYAIIGIGDYAYQKWKFKEDMKMTKQEVKDEWKNAEGDPEIKGKQKQRMREASRRRMMSAIPQADVVITNPTHFAVALKYDPDRFDAPYVLAKGEDFLAMRIREEAYAHDIEVVENKPLARMLYYNVDLGAQIPQELYATVAEILAVIYNKRNLA
ncbi:MAG: flagellar biosynthesis protein FlhB [Lachnospiraceae bacterium]|nr:flagellar biosynthesis protein FlhB [Parasporobacterium sp.]MBR4169984.1 flagellar biosynthesis protein FlhB [Lachnospiraceae bacterium]